MPTSEARISANTLNAAKSTGPKTPEGQEKSRRNSFKHGLTGAGVVLAEADAAEVARRTASYADELDAMGDVGQALARLAAIHSVRVERAADQQTAALTQRVRQIEAEFVPPEGVDDDEAAQLRAEAGRIAMFDPSKEATLARQYQAAAERGFYKALKELRLMERQAEALLKADDTDRVDAMMASFLKSRSAAQQRDTEFDALSPERDMPMPRRPANSPLLPQRDREIDVPMTIGRAR
jgi:hypothetical protein